MSTNSPTTSAELPKSILARIRSAVARFKRDRRGASFIEYIIVVGLVAIVAIAAFQKFGQTVVKKLQEEEKGLDGLKPAG
jgi:pilus assembly protein Flp/PilA